MAKKTDQIIYDEHIVENALEDVMHNAFMSYAEYVILERALPRVEDGLKPVQRRILYTFNELGITPDKPYKKSARIVGEALAKYHPHGDTSVYDAMVRLAQDFSMGEKMVDGHGNFGSMDGDSAAAMRYTEVRLAPIALEMLRDIHKDTVPFRPNFDDSEWEPEVLPARFPNILVNGSSGIAVGIATNIPPHNLGETIDGTICRMDNPHCSLEDVLEHIKGPDFPTGGYVVDSGELKQAYKTGKGKIYIRAKAEIEKAANGKSLIIISQIPYELKKSYMLEKIYQVSMVKKDIFSCIDDIRDESDKDGVRGVIEIKKGVDPQKILALLYKYTDLQITFGINMMVIAGGMPKQMGLLEILDAYIAHQKNVITRRTRFDLEKAEKREHILLGLIIAVENIDKIVKIIRGSKDVKQAKEALMKTFDLTGVQSQAILDMRLARLTSLEVITLQKEYEEVVALIKKLHLILDSEKELMKVIKKDLLEIKKKYATPRKTLFVSGEETVKVDESEFKVSAECAVILSGNSSLKRMTPKALQKGIEAGVDVKNEPRLILNATTSDKISIFTKSGDMYILPVDSIPEGKVKDCGKTLNAIIAGVDKSEEISNIFLFENYSGNMIFVTKKGMVKKTALEEFNVKKSKILACGLKEGDSIVYCDIENEKTNMLAITKKAMSINIKKEEISLMGRAAKGVGIIKLAPGDEIVMSQQIDNSGSMVLTVTNKGYAKKTPISEYDEQGRNGKGLKTFVLNGETGDEIVAALVLELPCSVTVIQTLGDITAVKTDDVPIAARYSKGEQVVLALMGNNIAKVYKKIYE